MRCAVLGDPIGHSLSPALHRAAYAELGLDWRYEPVRVQAGGLADFVAGLDADWRGLSVTMPLKREAFALAETVSPQAAMAGAANTLVREGRGWFADNTDVPGAVAAFRERTSASPVVATILGGGSTAAATAQALCELGAGSITLLVRSPDRALETLAAIDSHPARPAVKVGAIGADEVVGDVVVSTIPASAQTPELVERCRAVPIVFDVVYDPWPTPLAESAADRVLVSGLDLLVHQAVLQLELFTGREAPHAAMRAAAERALADR